MIVNPKLTNFEKDVLNGLQEMNLRLNELEEWKAAKIRQEAEALEYISSLNAHHPSKDF